MAFYFDFKQGPLGSKAVEDSHLSPSPLGAFAGGFKSIASDIVNGLDNRNVSLIKNRIQQGMLDGERINDITASLRLTNPHLTEGQFDRAGIQSLRDKEAEILARESTRKIAEDNAKRAAEEFGWKRDDRARKDAEQRFKDTYLNPLTIELKTTDPNMHYSIYKEYASKIAKNDRDLLPFLEQNILSLTSPENLKEIVALTSDQTLNALPFLREDAGYSPYSQEKINKTFLRRSDVISHMANLGFIWDPTTNFFKENPINTRDHFNNLMKNSNFKPSDVDELNRAYSRYNRALEQAKNQFANEFEVSDIVSAVDSIYNPNHWFWENDINLDAVAVALEPRKNIRALKNHAARYLTETSALENAPKTYKDLIISYNTKKADIIASTETTKDMSPDEITKRINRRNTSLARLNYEYAVKVAPILKAINYSDAVVDVIGDNREIRQDNAQMLFNMIAGVTTKKQQDSVNQETKKDLTNSDKRKLYEILREEGEGNDANIYRSMFVKP